MKKTKVIIIDDERLSRVELKNHLDNFQNIEVIGEAKNADEGIELIKEKKPDLIFLDIQMPERSGFDLLEELEETPSVIFVTAFDEYAIKAFEFNALHYILKPINRDRLQEALDRSFEKQKEKETIKSSETGQPYIDHLFLKDGEETHFVKLSDIHLFSSFGNYVKVHFGTKSILVHRSLNQIEIRVPTNQFFRVNRYSIVNLNHVNKIRQGLKAKLILTLSSGQEIECSERKSVLFRERWGI